MQRSLLRWRLNVCCLLILYFLNSSMAWGQLNYTLSKPTTTYSSNNNPTVILSGGTNDGLSSSRNIGFSFKYGCNIYTTFKASSNGWLCLGGSASSSIPNNNLNTIGQGPIIAPLWDDMSIDGSGNVNMKLSGSSPNRVLTIEWRRIRWNSSASEEVMSFQVRLYETSNLIDFIYNQESLNVNNGSASIGINGGGIAGDFYSINSVTGNTAVYGTETNNINTKPADNLVFRWTPNDMAYISATTTQITGPISKCNNIQQAIIGVQIVTRECYSPISLTELRMNMTGTSAISNISAIHIYYTGSSSGFSPVNEFSGGSVTPSAGTITVSGSQALLVGTNYFWIAYDVNSSLPTTESCDAQCTQLTVGGYTRIPSVIDPPGSRSIDACTVAPGGITNSSFWISSNTGTSSAIDNTTINQWNDRSGNNRHATQSSSANRPIYYDNDTSNLNFNPIVDFDEALQNVANADFMDITSNSILSPGNNSYEVYAVIIPGGKNLTKPGKFLFSGDLGTNTFNSFDVRSNNSFNDSWGTNDLITSNTWTTKYPTLATFRYNYINREMYIQGGLAGTRTSVERVSPDLNSALGCQRAASPSIEFYDGGIAEIITYANKSLDQDAQKKIESYLAIKYGITLAHNYYSSNRTTVWNRSLNAAYNNNIIGIARDSISDLLQKQSKSTSLSQDILTIYIGPSKQTNQKNNSGTFAGGDRSFFMVGSNNASALASFPQTAERPAGICCRILREWLVQKTNFTNTDITLEFDFNAITSGYLQLNSADLRLLVDADGDFSNATILNTPTITINAAAGIATIRVPASQLPNNSYFTLASVSANTALPLQLKAFSGLCKDQTIQLKWTMASPTQNDFIIERSHDKVNFSPAGIIKSNISGNYTWTDQSPLPGTMYYRLKMTDDNGSSLYSTILTVNSCNTTGIQLSTNPVTNESTLMLQLPQNSLAEINLYDLLGRRFEVPGLTGKRSMERGVHYLPVRIPTTAAGMYLLYVTIGGERHVYRILKK